MNKAVAFLVLASSLSFGQMKLEVFQPPSNPPAWLTSQPLVAGASFFVYWNQIEASDGSYNFSAVDQKIAVWTSKGKKANLIVFAVSLSAPNSATPSWLMSQLGTSNQVTCASEKIPNYFSSVFQNAHRALMAAVLKHYASNPGIGYIRFGLGRGGETHPAPTQAFVPGNSCYTTFQKLGWTPTSWENYLKNEVDYEALLGGTIPKMVTISNELGMLSISDTIAANAAAVNIGLGYQGYGKNDISKFTSGKPCLDDWCALYLKYWPTGIPLELQLGEAGSISSPTGTGNGSLVQLLPFATKMHANIFEVNYQDWRVAFDPTDSYYAKYHLAYQQALAATQ